MPRPVPDRDKVLKFRELRARLAKNGVVERPNRGKGSHRMFIKIVQHIREKFQISMEDFYE